MENKKRFVWLLLIFSILIIVSAILSFFPIEKICGGTQTGCYEVQTSEYEEIFGIKSSFFGMICFSILFGFIISEIKTPKKYKRKLIFLGIILSSIFAIYFIYLQLFVIKEFCKYCLIVDIGILISLFIICRKKKKCH